MRIAVVEWPDGLEPAGAAWEAVAAAVELAAPDILVTNELPFGPWIAAKAPFDTDAAALSIEIHTRGIQALARLGVPAILSSRPVWEGARLANEAVAIEGGAARGIHRKQYFPAEAGWRESDWYATAATDFTVAELAGLPVGTLLCTEAMFNEYARLYGRNGAALIAIPRAAGISTQAWHIAGAMAALVGGCYVVSSNRVGGRFGGEGFAYAPGGDLIGMTSREQPIFSFELDIGAVRLRQREYPCSVAERGYIPIGI